MLRRGPEGPPENLLVRVSKIWGLVLGLLLLALAVGILRKGAATVARECFYPFQNAACRVRSGLLPRLSGLFRGASATARAIALEEDRDLLLAQIAQLESVAAENRELRRQLGFARASGHRLVACPVIPGNGGGWWTSIRLGRGASDGLAVGQVALNADGLVGRVVAVTPSTADVMLLTDPNFRLSCEIPAAHGAPPARGILYGAGVRSSAGVPELLHVVEPLALRYLGRDSTPLSPPPRTPVRTTGEGGHVPAGLLVGYLLDSRPDFDGLCRVGEVAPAVDFAHLPLVFVRVAGGSAR
jgi:rod shape-determining protein MreC